MWTGEVSLLVFLLLVSAFFSSTEAAFFSLNRVQLRRMERDGRSSSRRVLRFLARPSDLLILILTGNTLVNVAASVIATVLAVRLFGARGVEISLGVLTVALLLVGEITPKTLGVNFPEGIARAVVPPLRAVRWLLAPLIAVVTLLSNGMLRLLRLEAASFSATPALSRGELSILLEGADQQGVLETHESLLVQNILEFSSTRAEEVMTPRVDMVAAPAGIAKLDLTALLTRSKHSRIPIYQGTIDDVTGYVHARDALLHPERKLEELLRPALVFPNRARVALVFYEMQRRRVPLVIVVNEWGETVGLLTREDLLEELVGEIYDEFEAKEEHLRVVGTDVWSAPGRLDLEELNEALEVTLPVEDAYTLNGFLAGLVGGIPRRGDHIRHGDLEFEIVEVSRHRIQRCLIRKLHAETGAEDRSGSWT